MKKSNRKRTPRLLSPLKNQNNKLPAPRRINQVEIIEDRPPQGFGLSYGTTESGHHIIMLDLLWLPDGHVPTSNYIEEETRFESQKIYMPTQMGADIAHSIIELLTRFDNAVVPHSIEIETEDS